MAGWRRRGPLTKVPHHNNEIRFNLDLRSTSPRANLVKPLQSDLQHPIIHHQSSTQPFNDTLDAPPKYEDIFKGGVHSQVPQKQHQEARRSTSFEKKRIKSYLLRHLPKPRTPNDTFNTTTTTSSNNTSRRQHQNIVREEGYINRERYYAEINIPTSSPLEYCSQPSPGAPPPTLHHPHPDHHQFVEMGQRQDHLVQEDCLGEGSGCSNDVGDSRSFTITVKPGRYRVNVQWRSKTHPFRIRLTPNKKKRCEAPPPTEQQPLYYSTSESHHEQHTTPSLPRRLVHRLLSHHSTSPSPSSSCHHQHNACTLPFPSMQEQLAQHQHSLLQQQVGFNPAACGNRKGQKRCWDGVTPRHRQRKSRYRWASLSCMTLGSLEESLGETSGGDSFGGYEGVEHLKRHSPTHGRSAACHSLPCGCQAALGRNTPGNVGVGTRRRRVAALGVNARLRSLGSACYGGGGRWGTRSSTQHVSTDDTFVFINKSQLRRHMGCDVVRERQHCEVPCLQEKPVVVDIVEGGKLGGGGEGKRRTWHEEEAFVKQVVEEYFQDLPPLSQLEDEQAGKILYSPIPTKRSMTADNILLYGKQMEVPPHPLSSSSASTSSESSEEMEEEEKEEVVMGRKGWEASIDDTTCGDSDDTNSWYTDDSLGYEADVEPSERDTGSQTWRRWRSAPDVRHSADVTTKPHPHHLSKPATGAVAGTTDVCVGGDFTGSDDSPRRARRGSGRGRKTTEITALHRERAEWGYQPCKSSSAGDGKLSRLKVGVRRVKQHHLLQFPQQDEVGRRGCHTTQNNNSGGQGVGGSGSVGGGAGSATHIETDGSHVAAGVRERLEFVNGKFQGGSERAWREEVRECVRRNVERVCEGSSVEDSTTERTHKVLSQGLVIHSGSAPHYHSIPNSSDLKTALSILREGLAELELGAATTSGGASVPTSEQLHKEVGGERQAVPEEEGGSKASATTTTTTNATTSQQVKQEGQGAKGGSHTQQEESSISNSLPQEDMNRTNIVIHLSPALPRRPGQEVTQDSPIVQLWSGTPSVSTGPVIFDENGGSGGGEAFNGGVGAFREGSGGVFCGGGGGIYSGSQDGEESDVWQNQECGGSEILSGSRDCEGGGGMLWNNDKCYRSGQMTNNEVGGGVWNCQEFEGSGVTLNRDECGVLKEYEVRNNLKSSLTEKSEVCGIGRVVWNSQGFGGKDQNCGGSVAETVECTRSGVVWNNDECSGNGLVTKMEVDEPVWTTQACGESGLMNNHYEGVSGMMSNNKECGEVMNKQEYGESGMIVNKHDCKHSCNNQKCGKNEVVWNNMEFEGSGVVPNSQICGLMNSQESLCGGVEEGNVVCSTNGSSDVGGVRGVVEECGITDCRDKCVLNGRVWKSPECEECGVSGDMEQCGIRVGGGGGGGGTTTGCVGDKDESGQKQEHEQGQDRQGQGYGLGQEKVQGQGQGQGQGRRSSSLDTSTSSRRRQRSSIELRASSDNLSSSSGTSSCCHSRPKWKSKSSSKFIQIPSSGGGGHESASSTTSSSKGRISDFQLHRVQVGTGDDIKFTASSQRTVSVTGDEDSDNTHTLRPSTVGNKGEGGGVQKSELILQPPEFPVGRGGKQKHTPSFLSFFPGSTSNSNKTCVSEYIIGDSQPHQSPSPDSSKLLSHEFKMAGKLANNAKENDQGKKSSKRNKPKSKSKRYFSGIFNAFSSAAPRLRGMTSSDNQWDYEKKERERKEREKRESNKKEQVRKDSEKESEGKEHEKNYNDGKEHEKNENESGESEGRESVRVESKGKGNDGRMWSARQVASGGSSRCPPQPLLPNPISPPTPAVDIQGGLVAPRSHCVNPAPVAASSDGTGRDKSEILQVWAPTQDSTLACPEYPPVSDVVPTPSPRPRRAARKNTLDSLGNPVTLPTPPTRRRHAEEATGEIILNICNKDSSVESPQASPRARHGRQPDLQSVDGNFRCSPPAAPQPSYENVGFHEQHTFSSSFSTRVNTSLEESKSDPSPTHNRSRSHTRPAHSSSTTRFTLRSRSAGVTGDNKDKGENNSSNEDMGIESHHIPSSRPRRAEGAEMTPEYSEGVKREDGITAGYPHTPPPHTTPLLVTSPIATTSRATPPRAMPTSATDQNINDSMNETNKRHYDKGQKVSGGGMEGRWNGGGGMEYSGTPHNRRRRPRPPSLPTTPPQAARPRRTSQSTSGGSLSSSPTHRRRPKTEETWVDKEEGHLSRSPSAESLASESNSLYYSAVGSLYERPKSLYDDSSARYSFVTCPQFEPLTPLQESGDPDSASLWSQERKGSTTNLPRTISGDLNCSVDVSLSEGEIKIRVRTDDEEDVVSLTSVRGDSDSESDEYDLSSDIRELGETNKCASPESCRSTSDSDNKVSSRSSDDEDEEEGVDVSVEGVVHARPCMAGTDSSTRSSVGSFEACGVRYRDSLCSVGCRESGLMHATPCWATTDSDVRSSVSSTDIYNKMYVNHATQEGQPHYENVRTAATPDKDTPREPLESRSDRRRSSCMWNFDCDTDEDTSEAEEEEVTIELGNLQKSFTEVSKSDDWSKDEARGTPSPRYHEAADAATLEEDFTPEQVKPLAPTPPPEDHHAATSQHTTSRHDDGDSSDGRGNEARQRWEQQAWAWQQNVWQHHQQLHQHHLHHLHHLQHHHHQHQSLLAEVMSCLGGGWGLGGSWCAQSYQQQSQPTHPTHHASSPDCRWPDQTQEDPPYRPTSAASNSDVGKPPPSPLPPSGSNRSRDNSVPRERSRPPVRQRSRSHRRAHSANSSSRYRVELEIPPHLFTRPRPSSFTSLATSSTYSPEPFEVDSAQESLLYLPRQPSHTSSISQPHRHSQLLTYHLCATNIVASWHVNRVYLNNT
ncbi:hypothetical protein Pmani_006852 [Petrolisthes manimaculis]|uniref:Uncharacterized protein n=1 Tax=Petrolisthes manimaculis TaxID=1843537 RepID=A0AAE1QA92_9EUCA|nr:hypothetical protein Pmani_006852 [Petrolisthes manimaculis]